MTAQEQDVTAPPDDLVLVNDLRDESVRARATGDHVAADVMDSGALALESLTAENKALREALRKRVLDSRMCYQCHTEQLFNSPEDHAPGCLAAGAANEP